MSRNNENDLWPSTEVYNNRFKWLLTTLWLFALAGITFFYFVQINDDESSQKSSSSSQSLSIPDSSFSGLTESPVRPSPSKSPSTSNRIQPVAPSVTLQDIAGRESGVYTYVCKDLKIAPSRMQFQCQDGENFIDDIIWIDWKATGATGKGILNQSDCSFGCKSPRYSKYPVTVKLSSPISEGKMVYFRRLDYLYVSASGKEYPGFWDPTAVHEGRVISEDG